VLDLIHGFLMRKSGEIIRELSQGQNTAYLQTHLRHILIYKQIAGEQLFLCLNSRSEYHREKSG
jgi:hypothetical protein